MKSPDTADLFRNIAFHAQPMALMRPRAASSLKAALPAPAQRDAGESMKPAPPPRAAGYEEGYAKGCEDGRRVGLERGMAEADVRSRDAIESARVALRAEAALREKEQDGAVSALLNELSDLREKFDAASTTCLDRLERDAAALAFEAVCRIVGDGPGQGEQVARCVRTSMQALRAAKLLRIRLRPGDLDRLMLSTEGTALTRASDAVEWVADPGIVSGGCVLDTDLGSIDAQMEVQLDGLRRAWSDAARNVASMLRSPQ